MCSENNSGVTTFAIGGIALASITVLLSLNPLAFNVYGSMLETNVILQLLFDLTNVQFLVTFTHVFHISNGGVAASKQLINLFQSFAFRLDPKDSLAC